MATLPTNFGNKKTQSGPPLRQHTVMETKKKDLGLKVCTPGRKANPQLHCKQNRKIVEMAELVTVAIIRLQEKVYAFTVISQNRLPCTSKVMLSCGFSFWGVS